MWYPAATSGRCGVGCGRTSSTPMRSAPGAQGTAAAGRAPRSIMAERRKPTLAIRGSVAMHAGALTALAVRPHWWPWLLGAVVADHVMLTAAGLWPRSTLLGPNWTRLPGTTADGAA